MVTLTFQLLLTRLLNCQFFSFLFCFVFLILFFLSVSIEFLDVFFVSLASFSHPPPPCSRQEGHATICFAPDHSFDYSCVLGLRKKYGLFCGLKDFALIDVSVPGMETLAVILIELQIVPFNSVWKENMVFSA